MSIASGAILEFLPQETILFEGARLRRETTIDLEPDAAFLGGDIVVFGRRARGERFTSGFLREVWEVHREGRLVWGDALHLEDAIAAIIDDPACFDGAAAFATMILAPAGRDPSTLVESARVIQLAGAADGLRAGVTGVAGLVIARAGNLHFTHIRKPPPERLQPRCNHRDQSFPPAVLEVLR